MTSAIYAGKVFHTRTRPRQHKLVYRVFSLLLDLNEIDTLGLKLLGRTPAFSRFGRRGLGVHQID